MRGFSVAQRMSWASCRMTTRLEDEAYSLLGLFNVNMSLLYGEGRNAFFRLQKEIKSTSTDMSIIAWDMDRQDRANDIKILASRVSSFKSCQNVVPYPLTITQFEYSNTGLRGSAPILPLYPGSRRRFWILLNCQQDGNILGLSVSIGTKRKSSPTLQLYLDHMINNGPRIQLVNIADILKAKWTSAIISELSIPPTYTDQSTDDVVRV